DKLVTGVQTCALPICQERAQYATIALFTLARKHGDHVRAAWPAVVACMCRLFDAQLVSAAVFGLDDPFPVADEPADVRPQQPVRSEERRVGKEWRSRR